MENNKKPQNFSRPINSKTSQSADSKRRTDLQASKLAFPRAGRRRDQQPTGPRNDQVRNSKQLPAKQRAYVDKRPRARGGGSSGSSNSYIAERGIPCLDGDDVPTAGAGLVQEILCDGNAGVNDTSAIGDFTDYNQKTLQMCNVAGKRKNLNHLLNFQYAPRETADYLGGGGIYGVFGSYGANNVGKRHQQQHKYNKEHFLQANFQFVIKSSAKPHLISSPDTIIDWGLIEQINIQTTEEPRCPICLYPPVAAKLTRCGHAYCWPCILHYLALNDKSWRKCPICYEAIHVADLKSTAILQQSPFNVGDEITFQLMRRKKGSFFVEKFLSPSVVAPERYPQYSGTNDLKAFSKFLLAKRSDILTIIERERAELLADEDTTCPEYVFVQQALNLLNERREKLGEVFQHYKDEEDNEFENANQVKDFSADINDDDNNDNNDDDNIVLERKIIENEGKFESAEIEIEQNIKEFNNLKQDDISTTFDENQDDYTTFVDGAHAAQQKYYFFYQSLDGQNIFLHPLNVKMLQACYGSLEYAPLTINARILQKECHTMDEELRRKFTCLGHLPLTCQFSVLEVDMHAPIVSLEILSQFKDDIRQRRMERERREREEKKREKKIAAINDRQMGKLISKTANINISSAVEFPVCGFDYDLMPAIGATANSISKSAKIDIKPVEVSASSVSGTPPGPSYSSVIMSNDISKNNNNAGLFPELPNRGKAKKNVSVATTTKTTSSTTTTTSGTMNSTVLENDLFEQDAGDAFKSMGTTFGDFMEKALVRKKASNASNPETVMTNSNNVSSGKKQKREKKKMMPLFP